MGSGHVDDPRNEEELDQDEAIANLEKQIAERAADRDKQTCEDEAEQERNNGES